MKKPMVWGSLGVVVLVGVGAWLWQMQTGSNASPQTQTNGQGSDGAGQQTTAPGQPSAGDADAQTDPKKPSESPSAIRGVIEGFYGQPWTQSQRMSMFRFMGQAHLNTYVYAPKDDPYQRLDWAVPYPSAQAGQMQELVKTAQANRVQFVYSISPALPAPLPGEQTTAEQLQKAIVFSSVSARAKLEAKIDQVRSFGVHTVMLSFDDVQLVLRPEDQKVYGNSAAKAHMELANELLKIEQAKDPQFHLWMAPTSYYGVEDDPYWQTLRTTLDPSVQVIWTGPSILSKQITAGDADAVAQWLGRKPLIWDNYPVNDYTYVIKKRPQLFMGPLEQRDRALAAHTAGYLANPMIQPEASKMALYTIGQYLNAPDAYDPDAAWQAAIDHMDGVRDKAKWKQFVAYGRTSLVDSTPSPFPALADAFWQSRAGGGAGDAKALRAELTGLRDLPKGLHDSVDNPQLLTDIDPWLTKLGKEGDAGLLALDLLDLPTGDAKRKVLQQQLETKLQALKNDPLKIGDEVLDFCQKALTL